MNTSIHSSIIVTIIGVGFICDLIHVVMISFSFLFSLFFFFWFCLNVSGVAVVGHRLCFIRT